MKNMDIIEQAAKRLAELRQSGIDVPGNPAAAVPEAVTKASTVAAQSAGMHSV